MKASATSALVALAAVLGGCEVVAGIKSRPLAEGGSGGSAGSTAGAGGAAGRGGDGAAGTGGSIGGTGGQQTRIGTSCPALGAHDCDGPMSKQALSCGAGNLWTTSTTCGSAQLCDSRAGDTQGTCLPVIPECAGQAPQDHVCVAGELRACGPDLVSSEFIDGCSSAAGGCARCRPVMLGGGAGQQGQPTGIAIDTTYVYWRAKDSTSGLGMARSPIDGSGGLTFLGGDVGAGYIAIRGSGLYGVVLGALGKSGPVTVPLESGPAVVLDTSATNFNIGVGCLAVDENNVYWSPGGTAYLGGAVLRLPLAGGTSAPIAMNQGMVIAITFDAGNVYWTTAGGAVGRAPINGGSVDMLATGQQSPHGLVVSDGIVYWSNGAGGVSAVSTTGGAVMTLAAGPNSNPSVHYAALGIAVDATNVYWSDPTNNKIMRVRKSGGAPVIVAGAALPLGLAMDDTAIYWANGSTYTIMKIAK